MVGLEMLIVRVTAAFYVSLTCTHMAAPFNMEPCRACGEKTHLATPKQTLN